MQIEFVKYEGAGNDFILIDNRDAKFEARSETIARLCDRHFGIGADGLMTLTTTPEGVCSMLYYNADGSLGEMCGNGARCFTLFAYHLGIGGKTMQFLATDGPHTATVLHTEGDSGAIELGMTDVHHIQTGEGWWVLNTGVPHYIEFVDDVSTADVVGRGQTIRRDTARFPQGTNVNFVQVTGDGSLHMRTYERGVEAETLACGTGATAAAIIANYAFSGNTEQYRIEVPGGELTVRFSHIPETTHYTDIRLSGPARRVFRGSFETEKF